jgi:hypothetical protein
MPSPLAWAKVKAARLMPIIPIRNRLISND